MTSLQFSARASNVGPGRRLVGLLLAISIIAPATIIASRALAPHLTVNVTSSLPRGLYWLSTARQPDRGSIVTLPPPDSVRELVATRGYLPPSVLLLKRVVALAGDTVCIADNLYLANGVAIDVIAAADQAGRPLPRPFPFCGVVPPGVAFVAGHGASSLDSRYFGPVPLSTLTVAVPLWTSS
jgi:conjugative transfer signal peptidase TraF